MSVFELGGILSLVLVGVEGVESRHEFLNCLIPSLGFHQTILRNTNTSKQASKAKKRDNLGNV